MNGVFETICIFLAFVAVIMIFAVLRSIKDDLCCQSATLDLIDARIKLFDAKKEYREVSEIAEAYEQGKKDAHIWTPTAESLPPLNEFVLASDRLGGVITLSLTKNSNGVYTWHTSPYEMKFEAVNAWQKLPDPYREDEE